MIQGLYSALSAIKSGSIRQDVTANNISNINTPGFKGSISVLSELSKGGVQVLSVNQNNNSGYLIRTNNPLDLSINGKGYFKLESGDNVIYTRNGSFKQDINGNITDSKGNILVELPENTKDITINPDGSVYSDNEQIAQINIYSQDGQNISNDNFEILQGYLESSNVDYAKEIVDTIINSNYVSANTKIVNAVDEMIGTIVDMKS